MPPRDEEPDVARQAYIEAKADWQRKQAQKNALVAGLVAVTFGVALAMLQNE